MVATRRTGTSRSVRARGRCALPIRGMAPARVELTRAPVPPPQGPTLPGQEMAEGPPARLLARGAVTRVATAVGAGGLAPGSPPCLDVAAA